LLTLIDDIIDISKIEAGQITIRMTETSVNTIMHELLASFQTTKINENKSHIEIVNNNTLPDDKVVIYTDPYRFRQIFSNLIGNALKFTNEGTIEFGYKHNDPDNLEFYVKDSGIGIPKDKQNMIFERFGKIIDTKITNKKGTGLGLAIASNLTLLLGGKMRVDSDEGKGSIFYFTLPYKPISGQANIKTPFDFSLVNLKGKTILIAEDEDTSFFYYKELFKDTGVKLLWVKNGNDAIHSFKFNQGISLIIMDCHMPEMDGLTAIREIKKLNKNMVPIIAHTSFAKAEEKEQYLREGSAAYLSKPVLKDELFRLIYKLIC
jgi:CheY-like chemotaxis protein